MAVIIGNQHYQGGRIPSVSYAWRDVDALRDYLVQALGYREGNIIDLRDATQAQMVAAFGNRDTHQGRLWRYVRPGKSDVTVYYSGHGVPGLKDRRGYLLPADADPDQPEINGYPLDLLYRNLEQLQARSVTVYLDACFSGESSGGMLLRAASSINIVPRLPTPSHAMVVITAARGNEVASWDEKNRHGLFTYYLLRALNGAADAKPYGDGDRRVTLTEVRAYLDSEMTYAARRNYGRVQEASLSGPDDALLGIVPKIPMVAAPTAPVAAPAATADPTVREAQERLGWLGYDAGPADGMMGSRTKAAIESFQRDGRLTVDGEVTDLLMAKLKDAQAFKRVLDQIAPLRDPTYNPQRPLTISEIELVRQQIARCWNLPAGIRNVEDLDIKIHTVMNPDGTVHEAHIVNQARMQNDPDYRAAAESALRAVLNPRCSPLKLPLAKYDQWKDLDLNFNPREMF